eukprot:scaffold3512_cov223-Ochromonas_danica.AAC.4
MDFASYLFKEEELRRVFKQQRFHWEKCKKAFSVTVGRISLYSMLLKQFRPSEIGLFTAKQLCGIVWNAVWNVVGCCGMQSKPSHHKSNIIPINTMMQKKTPFSFLSRGLPLMRCANRSYKHPLPPLLYGYHVNGPRRVLAGGWSSGTVRLLSSSREMSVKEMETNPLSSSSGDGLLKEEQNKGGARAGRRMWTAEEDMLLRKGVEELGEKWVEIFRRYLPHRSRETVGNRWNNVLRPDLKSGAWSAEEDAKLLELVKQYGESSWTKIAPHMDGRSVLSCSQRWRNVLDPSVDRSEWKAEEDEIIKKVIMEDMDQKHVRSEWQSLLALLPTERSYDALRLRYQSLKNQLFPVKKAQWTKENDAKLLELVKQHGARDWYLIASYLPQYNRVQCLHRYDRISKYDCGKSVAESLWTEEEDAELLKAVRQFGDSGKWSAVASSLSSSHTAMECKVRWERELSRLLNTSPWTKEEDDLLISLRSKGVNYADIFHRLKNRTYAAIFQRCEELGVLARPYKRWTKEEIALLVKLVNESKEGGGRVNWKWIAKQMPSERTADKESKEEKAEVEQEIEKSEKRTIKEHVENCTVSASLILMSCSHVALYLSALLFVSFNIFELFVYTFVNTSHNTIRYGRMSFSPYRVSAKRKARECFPPAFLLIDRVLDVDDPDVDKETIDWEHAAIPPLLSLSSLQLLDDNNEEEKDDEEEEVVMVVEEEEVEEEEMNLVSGNDDDNGKEEEEEEGEKGRHSRKSKHHSKSKREKKEKEIEVVVVLDSSDEHDGDIEELGEVEEEEEGSRHKHKKRSKKEKQKQK